MQPVKIISVVSFILEICIKIKLPLLWNSYDHQTLILIHDLRRFNSELMFFREIIIATDSNNIQL